MRGVSAFLHTVRISIARDLLSRSLFGHLIAIRSLDPLRGFWRLVRRGLLSPSLSAQLIAPYKSADENLGFEANCATKMNFQTGSKG